MCLTTLLFIFAGLVGAAPSSLPFVGRLASKPRQENVDDTLEGDV